MNREEDDMTATTTRPLSFRDEVMLAALPLVYEQLIVGSARVSPEALFREAYQWAEVACAEKAAVRIERERNYQKRKARQMGLPEDGR